jgi:hypothetical protein
MPNNGKEQKTVIELLKIINKNNTIILGNIGEFKDSVKNIETNTKTVADTLKMLHKDNREYVELIAGKRQVPISIFAIVVLVLVTLLVAQEVRISNVDLSVNEKGVIVTPHDNIMQIIPNNVKNKEN